MVKKNKLYWDQQILLFKFLNVELDNLIVKSLLSNYEILPKIRYSMYLSSKLSEYKTKRKLKCIITASKRVPTHKLKLSRYYLTKFSDKLHISGIHRA